MPGRAGFFPAGFRGRVLRGFGGAPGGRARERVGFVVEPISVVAFDPLEDDRRFVVQDGVVERGPVLVVRLAAPVLVHRAGDVLAVCPDDERRVDRRVADRLGGGGGRKDDKRGGFEETELELSFSFVFTILRSTNHF